VAPYATRHIVRSAPSVTSARRCRTARALTVVLILIAVVFARRVMPLAANVDDHFRLYFGGYVGLVQLAGGEAARSLGEELRSSTRRFADRYLAARFVTAQTPYSPLTTATVAAAEAARPFLPAVRGVPWVLGVQTLAWLAVLALALWLRARLPACGTAWFLAVGLALTWMHVHTSPFLPAPRAVTCLFTGLSLALAATGTSERWAALCLFLAAAAHPYNQAVNLAVVLPATALVAGTAAAPALRGRTALRLAGLAVAGVAVAVLAVAAGGPGAGVDLGNMWGERRVLDPVASWRTAQPLALRLTALVGLPTVALVLRSGGRARAAGMAALFVASVVAASTLQPVGDYPGEYLQRIGGAWVAFLFGLCLREDPLGRLPSMRAPRRLAVAAAVVLASLPAAFPELAGVRGTTHQPLRGWPGGALLTMDGLGRVEAECMRIMRERPLRGRRRSRPRVQGQGERPGSTPYTRACASAYRRDRPGTRESWSGVVMPSQPWSPSTNTTQPTW
jgi:hypothetical protein